jgi:multimeric flavodoxin WrbA
MVDRQLVVAVVGSPRAHGNTATLVAEVLEPLIAAGADCERFVLGEHDIRYCLGHDECEEWEECPIPDDTEAVLARMWAADGLVIGSPVYGDNVSGQLKVLLDRCCHRHNHGVLLRARAAALVTVSWGTGLDETLDAMERGITGRFPGPVPMLRLKGVATYLGDVAADAELRCRARALGGELAGLLGLCRA